MTHSNLTNFRCGPQGVRCLPSPTPVPSPNRVLRYDYPLSSLGPNATLETPALATFRGDSVEIDIARGALTANTPSIRASSPTGGVELKVTSDLDPNAGIGAASPVKVRITPRSMPGGLDHRTVYIEDQSGNRLLSVRLPIVDVAPAPGPMAPMSSSSYSLGVPAPFTDADSHNGKNKILSPGQEFFVALKDNPTTGHRWADKIWKNDNYFQLLASSYVPSGGAIGAGGSRVYHFKVREDALEWHKTQKQVPATLSIYKLAPGESFEDRTTRGDGSGAEFSMNTVILNSPPAPMHVMRAQR
jgi:predicted secreted protein